MSTTSQVATPAVYSFIPSYMQDTLVEHYSKNAIERVDGFEDENLRHARRYSIGEMSISDELHVPLVTSKKMTIHNTSSASSLTESPREVWNANGKAPLLLLSNTQKFSSRDNEAKNCYINMGKIDAFFRETFSTYPVLNSSKLMRSYIHCPYVLNNAFWDPKTESVYYGEVDTTIFSSSFVNNYEISTHEFGHAVTHYSADLVYLGQSGALNESISDIFAIMAKHREAKTNANHPNVSWLIGENLIINPSGGPAMALRSMIHPGTAFDHPILGKDPQPAYMKDYKRLPETDKGDWGGVHINSGIPNRAFCLAATQLQGPSWEKAGKIWYHTLVNIASDANFVTFAERTLQSVNELQYGEAVYQCVAKGWTDVGVDLRGISLNSGRASPSSLSGTTKLIYWSGAALITSIGVGILIAKLGSYSN